MGIEEIALLTALEQIASAIVAYLTRIQPVVSDPYGVAAVVVGIQLATNLESAASAGILAAMSEFSATQAAELNASVELGNLPPIT